MAEGRKRYPTRNGLPIKPVGIEECFEECPKEVNRVNKHHLAFNRAMYKTPIEKHYRESGSMMVRACICKHALLHQTYDPPPKPSVQTMLDVAQGDLLPVEGIVYIRGTDG